MRPTVARAAVPLAALYGFGAFWLVSALLLGFAVVLSSVLQVRPLFPYPPVANVVASAAAVAVGVRSGGWGAALLLAVGAALYAWSRCEANSTRLEPCVIDLGWIFREQHLPHLVGAVAGLPLAYALRQRDGISALLLAAGILGIAFPLLHVAFAPFGQVTGEEAAERRVWYRFVPLIAALGAGAVLGRYVQRVAVPLLTVAAALVLPWLFMLRLWWQDRVELQKMGFELSLETEIRTRWESFLPPIYLALVLLGFLLVRLVKFPRRPPRESSRG